MLDLGARAKAQWVRHMPCTQPTQVNPGWSPEPSRGNF